MAHDKTIAGETSPPKQSGFILDKQSWRQGPTVVGCEERARRADVQAIRHQVNTLDAASQVWQKQTNKTRLNVEPDHEIIQAEPTRWLLATDEAPIRHLGEYPQANVTKNNSA